MKKGGKKRLTAVISDVIRLQATTLGDFTLNLIFIVSQNGTCFLTVNKTAGDTALIIDVNGLLLCYSSLTAGQAYRGFILEKTCNLFLATGLFLYFHQVLW